MTATPAGARAGSPARATHRLLRSPLLIVLGAGLAVQGALLLGLARPLWLFDGRETIPTPEPLATRLGINGGGLLRFAVTLLVWLVCYGFVLALVRTGTRLHRTVRLLLVGFPALFAATLLFVLPSSSQDVYHYIMEGRGFAVYGANPARVPPSAHADDPLYWIINAWADTPSRYGPVHNLLAGGIAAVGGADLTVLLLLWKLAMVAALAGTAVLTALTMRRLLPSLALPAFVFVAWNPLALYEAAANAHNDLLMVCCTALALYFAVRGRIELALPALTLGILTKYVVVLLGPLLLIDWWVRAKAAGGKRQVTGNEPRTRSPSVAGHLFSDASIRLAAGVLLSLALTAALYAPFWQGMSTFDAVRSAAGDMQSSPGWLLRQALKPWLGWDGARPVVSTLLTTVFLAGYAFVLWQALRGRAADDRHWLPRAAFAVLLLELCTLSWWLWPWYALWLLPPAALLVDRRAGTLAAVISACCLLAYLPINYRELFWGPVPTDAMPLAAALVMFVPALLWLVVVDAHGRARRRPGPGAIRSDAAHGA